MACSSLSQMQVSANPDTDKRLHTLLSTTNALFLPRSECSRPHRVEHQQLRAQPATAMPQATPPWRLLCFAASCQLSLRHCVGVCRHGTWVALSDQISSFAYQEPGLCRRCIAALAGRRAMACGPMYPPGCVRNEQLEPSKADQPTFQYQVP
jgi:hypothetical protein